MAEMNVKLSYIDGLRFSAATDSGHEVIMDGDPKFGGANTGPRPTELLLAGLGGCAGMDVISILKKKRADVTGLEIRIKGLRAEEHPKRFTEIEMEFVIRGRGVKEEDVKRAVELSMDKYCSVKATIEQTSKVNFTYRAENE